MFHNCNTEYGVDILVIQKVCIEKYWFRFTMTRRCSHISFLFASHSVVSRVSCMFIFLKTDNCLKCIALMLPTFDVHWKARQISAAGRPSQHRRYFWSLVTRNVYLAAQFATFLRVFLHDTNKNKMQNWYLFDINILCKSFSNPVTYNLVTFAMNVLLKIPLFLYTLFFLSFIIITL